MANPILPQNKQDKRNGMLDAVLDYTKLGWPVFPLHNPTPGGGCSCGNHKCSGVGKHPRTPHGCLDATADATKLSEWWERWPSANVGIATGAVSGIIVVDVDPRHGGKKSSEKLVTQHGKFPITPVALTGGGGWHILFKHPGFNVANRAGILPGIDIRADGGYIVASPSLHVSGKRYAWRPDRHPLHVPLAPAPDWLIQSTRTSKKAPVGEWRELAAGVAEGSRNEATARLYGRLLRHHLDPRESLQLVIAWNRIWNNPPLTDDEVVKTANSIAQREFMRKRGEYRA